MLSWGYGCKIKGYLEVYVDMIVEQAGDEFLQFKCKFLEIMVIVCESCIFVIFKIMMAWLGIKVILLDDVFQYWLVKFGMNILFIEYSYFFIWDYFLFVGWFWEWCLAYEWVDIIIVSKCLLQLLEEEW